MQDERWKKIDDIFSAACELHGVEREEFVSTQCGSDLDLQTELHSLLAEHDQPLGSLGSPVFDAGLQLLQGTVVGNRSGKLIGKFRFGRMIGRGGMGEIYAAEDTHEGRDVAIKLVNELFALDPERIRRFRKEASAAARVSHENVARLYELCEIDGEHLIVMELVDGVNLRGVMADRLPFAKAIDIAIQIVSALVAAHLAGVVHRDIKPENVIIGSDGTAKVLDFGLAKLVDPIGDGAIHIPGGDDARLTVEMSTELGAIMGTPAYMSPEQIRGSDVDTRTDIWSAGVLLYEMLSGELPFRGPTKIDMIAAVLIREAPQIETIDNFTNVNAILRKALAKKKSERYPDAGALLADLQSLKTDEVGVNAAGESLRSVGIGQPWKYAVGLILIFVTIVALIPESRSFVKSGFWAASPPPPGVPVSDGLISYWSADGDSNDRMGANNGELLNGATYRPGVSGQAFSFDGVDDLFRAPTNGFPIGNKDRTLALWAMVDEFVSEEAPFGVYGAPNHGEAFIVGTSEKHPFVSDWGGSVPESAIGTGRWHHIVAVTIGKSEDTSTAYLYLDGKLANHADLLFNTAPGMPFYSGTTPFGKETDGIRRLKGAVDEICIYGRALSNDEIQKLYNAARPKS